MFILYVMWEASVFVGKLFSLQEVSAVGWMTSESSINVRQGKIFLSFSKHPDKLRPAKPPIQTVLRVRQLGQEPNNLSLCSTGVKNVWSCMYYTSTLLYVLTVCA
jgi:hypothetical protein